MDKLPNYRGRRSCDCERGVWYTSDYTDSSYKVLRKAIRDNLSDLKLLSEISDILSKLTIQNENRMQFDAYELLLDHLLDEADELLVQIAERFY